MAKKTGKNKGKETNSDFAKKLKGLKGAWDDAAENPLGDFDGWEDGTYHVKLVACQLEEAKASGRLQIRYEFEDMDGNEEGRQFIFDGLDTEQSPECLRYAQKHMDQLGFPCPKIANLEKSVAAANKAQPELTVVVKTKGEYQNTYIQNLMED